MKKIKLVLASLLITCSAMAQQTWHKMSNPSLHFLSNNMVLLSDGTVIIKTVNYGIHGYSGKSWNKLTPDSTGNYVNGTWSLTDSMHYDKIYFGTVLRSDGKVIAGKGMYVSAGDSNVCEMYNPTTNSWAISTDTTLANNGVFPATVVGAPTGMMKLANGTVPLPSGHTLTMYTPVITNTYPQWTAQVYFYKDTTLIAPPIGTGTYAPLWAFSSSMLALPDGSVLYCAGGKYPFIYK